MWLPRAWSLIPSVAGALKHASFEEEAEWRFVVAYPEMHGNRLEFRATESALVPYLPLALPKPLALDDVFIGPGARQVESVQAVRAFLEQEKVTYREVIASAAPYRYE